MLLDPSSVKPEIYSRDEHPISRKEIDPDALKIMYRLIRSGFKAYLVGGGVRDLLLGKKPKDYDIATDATPRRVKALFSNSRIIGRRFKLVHVFFGGGKIIEVSTFRDFSDPVDDGEAVEPEGVPLADNKYGTEVTDALRRDLTINGLFYDLATFSIIDYVGGLRDLADRVIRVIGDPDERFIEDPVRMLRVLRHAARASFSIERTAWDAIARNRQLIEQCPPMRVFEEIKKDLVSGYFLPSLRLFAQSQLLEFLMPELLHEFKGVFDDRSVLAKVLGSVDERSRAGNPPPLSAVLSALALLMREGHGDLRSSETVPFQSEEELENHLESAFSLLAVPRREGERVHAVLRGWLILMHNPDAELPRFSEREIPHDLAALLSLVDADSEIIRKVLDSARPGRQHSPQRRRRRRGGRRNNSDRIGEES